MHKASKKIRICISLIIGIFMSMPHITKNDINTTIGLICIPVLSVFVMFVVEWLMTQKLKLNKNNKKDIQVNRAWVFFQALLVNPLALLIELIFPNNYGKIYAYVVCIGSSLLISVLFSCSCSLRTAFCQRQKNKCR